MAWILDGFDQSTWRWLGGGATPTTPKPTYTGFFTSKVFSGNNTAPAQRLTIEGEVAQALDSNSNAAFIASFDPGSVLQQVADQWAVAVPDCPDIPNKADIVARYVAEGQRRVTLAQAGIFSFWDNSVSLATPFGVASAQFQQPSAGVGPLSTVPPAQQQPTQTIPNQSEPTSLFSGNYTGVQSVAPAANAPVPGGAGAPANDSGTQSPLNPANLVTPQALTQFAMSNGANNDKLSVDQWCGFLSMMLPGWTCPKNASGGGGAYGWGATPVDSATFLNSLRSVYAMGQTLPALSAGGAGITPTPITSTPAPTANGAGSTTMRQCLLTRANGATTLSNWAWMYLYNACLGIDPSGSQALPYTGDDGAAMVSVDGFLTNLNNAGTAGPGGTAPSNAGTAVPASIAPYQNPGAPVATPAASGGFGVGALVIVALVAVLAVVAIKKL